MKTLSHRNGELVRLFVAVELNEEARGSLVAEQARLMRAVGGVKWVPPEMIHLTMVFLGDVFAGQVEGIAAVLDAEAVVTPVFEFEVAGLGAFGPHQRPRVVWAGVGRGAESVGELQGRIDRGLRALNLSLESRPFHPHFTLGRVKSPREARGLADALALPGMKTYGVVPVNRVLLMSSELHPQGPVHALVHAAALKRG